MMKSWESLVHEIDLLDKIRRRLAKKQSCQCVHPAKISRKIEDLDVFAQRIAGIQGKGGSLIDAESEILVPDDEFRFRKDEIDLDGIWSN